MMSVDCAGSAMGVNAGADGGNIVRSTRTNGRAVRWIDGGHLNIRRGRRYSLSGRNHSRLRSYRAGSWSGGLARDQLGTL